MSDTLPPSTTPSCGSSRRSLYGLTSDKSICDLGGVTAGCIRYDFVVSGVDAAAEVVVLNLLVAQV
jgi:hypothetical protein